MWNFCLVSVLNSVNYGSANSSLHTPSREDDGDGGSGDRGSGIDQLVKELELELELMRALLLSLSLLRVFTDPNPHIKG
ncbi:hypothetical protein L484_017517 [Morus notabilis]|uniref:Uncharacterized protein n=1 Tax=Morus notabilis TaxID=981085 RepID=W9R1K7_9ROSA|nr:hypothetical protein L484_017517 [Morus notabilis]